MKTPRKSPAKEITKTAPAKIPDACKLPVRRLNLRALIEDAHDLGEVVSPEEQARAKHADANPWQIAKAAKQALAALAGSGPRQDAPHFLTALTLQDGLARLRDHALAGDKDAFAWLGFLVSQAVADLGEVARRHPKLAGEWGAKHAIVPVLTGKNKGHKEELAETLALFRVGEDSPYRVNPNGKRVPNIRTEANRIAGALCQHLSLAKASSPLPKLSSETWEEWEAAAWRCLLDATDQHPERVPELARLGVKATRKDGLQSPRTLAANVKAEIRQTLSEAIRGLASKGYSE